MTDEIENIQSYVEDIAIAAKNIAKTLAKKNAEEKNSALISMANAVRCRKEEILSENKKDLIYGKEKNLSSSMLDRLKLDESRIEAIAKGLEDIAKLDEPVGKILASWSRPNGLNIARVTTPIGVIGVIYESRPNVTADAGALCLKSGNVAVLRCGSESINSSKKIVEVLQDGLTQANFPKEIIQLISTRDREAVGAMLSASGYIDLIIPRGGKNLIKRIMQDSQIPTLQHLDGNCHTYIHHKADLDKAINISVNAKMRRTGICGATENIVVDAEIADSILPKLVSNLLEKNCEIRGDKKSCAIDSRIKQALEEDWGTEYLEAIVAIKIVKNIDAAITFVQKYSSNHTDAIITEDELAATRFLNEIDSAIVMHNASTQFADGGEFGMGAEIGIATGKLHARGPVGIQQLVTFKYQVKAEEAIRK